MKKRSKALTDLDPIERLKIQQKQGERDIASVLPLIYAGGKPDKERDYQGPMTKGAGSGTKDRMPGTSGFVLETKQSILDKLLQFLKIKKPPSNPTRIELTPTKRPIERYPGAI